MTRFSVVAIPDCTRVLVPALSFAATVSGVSYVEGDAFFDFLNDYKDHICDKVMNTEIIPKFTEQGLVAKLGMYSCFPCFKLECSFFNRSEIR